MTSVKGNGYLQQVRNSKGKPVKNSWQLVLHLEADVMASVQAQPLDDAATPLALLGKPKDMRKRVTRPFKGNKKEAQRALEGFRREIESGLKVNADKVTLAEYALQWQESRKASGRFSPATVEHDRFTVSHLVSYMGSMSLGEIDTTSVRSLYVTMAQDGIGQSTVTKAAAVLKRILGQAVDDDIILRNPCDRVKAPKDPKAVAGQTLDKDGLGRILAALTDIETRYYPYEGKKAKRLCRKTSDKAHAIAVRIALAAGLRRGEVLGLTWADVDFNKSMLAVRHTLCNVRHELKPPKTESSIRDVSIDADMLARLKGWKADQAEYLLGLGIAQSGATPVIANEQGGCLDGDNLARWWRAFSRRYGFEGLRFHDLRHTHATFLVSGGMNIKAVSERLGHASTGITLDLYAHALREDDEKAAAYIGQLMTQAEAPRMGQIVNL